LKTFPGCGEGSENCTWEYHAEEPHPALKRKERGAPGVSGPEREQNVRHLFSRKTPKACCARSGKGGFGPIKKDLENVKGTEGRGGPEGVRVEGGDPEASVRSPMKKPQGGRGSKNSSLSEVPCGPEKR